MLAGVCLSEVYWVVKWGRRSLSLLAALTVFFFGGCADSHAIPNTVPQSQIESDTAQSHVKPTPSQVHSDRMVNLSTYRSIYAAIQENHNNKITLRISERTPIIKDLEVPSNISLQFKSGSALLISDNVKVRLQGLVFASSNEQIFQLAGEKSEITEIAATEIYPQWWGAKGDGYTNDTKAFQKVSSLINRMGKGKIKIPKGIYVVGQQILTGSTGKEASWRSGDIINISNCQGKVVIQGEKGAVLRAADGLRFGSFHPVTGEAYQPPSMPFYNHDFRAGVYSGMISVTHNTDVEVSDLELDGNIQKVILGGSWGDTGRQLIGSGIYAMNNERFYIENIHTHHHPLDGVQIGYRHLTVSSPKKPHSLTHVVSEYNARQGLSWVGGNDLRVKNSKFNHTGKARFSSAPAAGLDIEAEESISYNGYFENCEFINNTGVGIVADSGDGGYTKFKNVLVWGTTNWSVWLRKPHLVMEDSIIYGSVPNAYGSEDAAAAVKFIRCHFEDKPHPDFGVYKAGYLIAMGGKNELFDSCTIVAHFQRSIYFEGTEILKDTTIIHKNSDLADHDFVAVVRSARLQNVHFQSAVQRKPANSWYIEAGPVVNKGIYVDGPSLRWSHPVDGRTGLIPQ